MFRVSDGKTFWLPAVIVANGDDGATTKTKVSFLVKQQEAEKIAEFQQLLITSQLPSIEQCSSEIEGWKGFANEAGEEIACDDENKAKVLKFWDVRYAFVHAYVTASTKGRGKN